MSGAMVCNNKTTNVWSLGGLHVTSNNAVLNRGSVGTRAIHSQPAQYFQHTSFESQSFNSFVGHVPATNNTQFFYPYHTDSSSRTSHYDHLLWLILVLTMLQPLLFSCPTCATLPFVVTAYLNAQDALHSNNVPQTFATTITHSTRP